MASVKINYTTRIEQLAKKLNVEISVAMDIDYMRQLEKRILKAARLNRKIRNFHVYNPKLEKQLDRLEK